MFQVHASALQLISRHESSRVAGCDVQVLLNDLNVVDIITETPVSITRLNPAARRRFFVQEGFGLKWKSEKRWTFKSLVVYDLLSLHDLTGLKPFLCSGPIWSVCIEALWGSPVAACSSPGRWSWWPPRRPAACPASVGAPAHSPSGPPCHELREEPAKARRSGVFLYWNPPARR